MFICKYSTTQVEDEVREEHKKIIGIFSWRMEKKKCRIV